MIFNNEIMNRSHHQRGFYMIINSYIIHWWILINLQKMGGDEAGILEQAKLLYFFCVLTGLEMNCEIRIMNDHDISGRVPLSFDYWSGTAQGYPRISSRIVR